METNNIKKWDESLHHFILSGGTRVQQMEYTSNVGNIKYSEIISNHYKTYNETTVSKKKKEMVDSIIQQLVDGGFIFVTQIQVWTPECNKEKKDCWTQMEDETIKKKVRDALNNLQTKENKRQEKEHQQQQSNKKQKQKDVFSDDREPISIPSQCDTNDWTIDKDHRVIELNNVTVDTLPNLLLIMEQEDSLVKLKDVFKSMPKIKYYFNVKDLKRVFGRYKFYDIYHHEQLNKEPIQTPMTMNEFANHILSQEACTYSLENTNLIKVLTNRYNTILIRNLKIAKEFLPGGLYCLMRSVPIQGRPDITKSPKLSITPPGWSTPFKQSGGNGAVDTCITVLQGQVKLLVLRTIPNNHQEQAKEVTATTTTTTIDTNLNTTGWPSEAVLKELKDLGYSPNIITLQSGELIIIGKGRLYSMFVPNIAATSEPNYSIFISWYFNYKGKTEMGIHRQVQKSLLDKRSSLAITKICLLRWAHCSFAFSNKPRDEDISFLVGLISAIRFIFDLNKKDDDGSGINQIPDGEDKKNNIDPYECGRYQCQYCSIELFNSYRHCEGCERQELEFNICKSCYDNERYLNFKKIHPLTSKENAILNHTGHFDQNSRACFTKGGVTDPEKSFSRSCMKCKKCTHCSCICHKSFHLRVRFFDQDQMQSLQDQFKKLVTAKLRMKWDTQINRWKLRKELVNDSENEETRYSTTMNNKVGKKVTD